MKNYELVVIAQTANIIGQLPGAVPWVIGFFITIGLGIIALVIFVKRHVYRFMYMRKYKQVPPEVNNATYSPGSIEDHKTMMNAPKKHTREQVQNFLSNTKFHK